MTDWEKEILNKYCEMKCHQSIDMQNICDYPEALVCHSDKIDLIKQEIIKVMSEHLLYDPTQEAEISCSLREIFKSRGIGDLGTELLKCINDNQGD